MASTAECYAEIKTSPIEGAGRGLFATKDLGAGELIFKKQRPLIASLETARREDTCAYCFKGPVCLGYEDNAQVNRCTGCRTVAYCSKPCQRQHWRTHKRMCKILDELDDELPVRQKMSSTAYAVVELMTMIDDPKASRTDWLSAMQLKSHVREINTADEKRYHDVHVIASEACAKLPGGDTRQKRNLAIQIACAMLTNSFELIASTLDPIGMVLDPLACVANHSCDPNAFVMMDGPILSLRTLKPIQSGEEILVSYVDSTDAFIHRQFELQDRWFFKCKCSKCLQGPTLPEDTLKEIGYGYSRHNYRDLFECPPADRLNILHSRYGVPEERATRLDPEDLNRMADLLIRRKYEELEHKFVTEPDQPPRKELIEVILRDCQESKMYEFTQQPLAGLVEDYIVACLDENQYDLAWLNAAKTWLEVDPVLYPPHHPKRVLHAYRFSRLANMYIYQPAVRAQNPRFSEEVAKYAGMMRGLEWLALKEAVANVDKSHGADSLFAVVLKEELQKTSAAMKKWFVKYSPDLLNGLSKFEWYEEHLDRVQNTLTKALKEMGITKSFNVFEFMSKLLLTMEDR